MRTWPAALLALLLLPTTARPQQPRDDGGAIVRAVLFFSPACPHCQDVLTEGLPPILERFGDRLQVAAVNTATPGGQELYRATVEHLALPRERVGVPTLLVGSRVLVGSLEIPQLLPGIVEEALAAEGIDWPPVPLIQRAVAADETRAEAEAVDSAASRAGVDASAQAGARPAEEEVSAGEEPMAAAPEEGGDPAGDATAEDAGADPAGEPVDGTAAAEDAVQSDSVLAGALSTDARALHSLSVMDRVMLDPAGNGAALAVLVLMLLSLGVVAADGGGRGLRIPLAPPAVIPALALVGLGVAAYLAVVEVTGAEAVCGPVGDCNTVQQSEYARLFGWVPIGVLGVLGYLAMLGAWAAARFGPRPLRDRGARLLWLLALVAVLFSLYLTVLEPFVIGASCAWCLSSALLATLILLAATPLRRAAPGSAA